MKSTLITILLALMVLTTVVSCDDCGCNPGLNDPDKVQLVSVEKFKTEMTDEEDKTHYRPILMEKYVIYGHDYMLIKNNDWYGQGWVHDPDCRKCHPDRATSHPLGKQTGVVEGDLSDYEKIFGRSN